jgi:CRISPR-associated protein Cas2
VFVLVVYDISDNGVRAELSNYLKAKGFVRIQRSAFIGRPLPSVLRDVERSMPRFIKGERDVVHLIPLVEVSVKNMRVYGHPLADVAVVRRLLVVE